MRALLVGVLCSVVAVCVGAAHVARADRGVAVDLGKIQVTQKLAQGGTYRLPPFGVRNPGTETTGYRVSVGFIEGQSERRPEPAWFQFEPAEVSLAPGESRTIEATLRVPGGARPDAYYALLQAEIVSNEEGFAVGGAAAVQLWFTVRPTNFLEAWRLETEDFLGDNSPWVYVIPGVVIVLLLTFWLRRRFTFSVGRRT